MDYYSSQISKLIQELSSLPGIGAKSAQRLAFHILNMPVEQVEELSSAIVDARKNVRYCKECFTLTDDELCPICKDAGRNHKTIMVVEDTRDLAAYEKTGGSFLFFKSNDLVKIGTGQGQQFQVSFDVIFGGKTILFIKYWKLCLSAGGRV